MRHGLPHPIPHAILVLSENYECNKILVLWSVQMVAGVWVCASGGRAHLSILATTLSINLAESRFLLLFINTL